MTRRRKIIYAAIAMIVLLGFGLALYTSQIDALPDSSYSLFATQPSPTSRDRVMVVSPHQDDEAIGAGVYIHQAVNAGAAVEIVFATDGNKHGLKDARHQEAVAADGVLGVPEKSLIFFDLPDGNLSAHDQRFNAELTAEITKFKPTVVITTMPQDDHPDHAECGRAVEKINQTNTSFIALYFLVHYSRYPRPIGYEPDDHLLPPLSLIDPDITWKVLPVSAAEQLIKASAIFQYKSQQTLLNPVLTQLIKSFIRQNELFAEIQPS